MRQIMSYRFGFYMFRFIFSVLYETQDNFKAYLCLLFHLCVASAAINGSVLTGLKGKLRFAAAVSANGFKLFTVALCSLLACVTASLAALGLVYKAFFSIKFLLARCKNKFVAAFFTDESFVFVHF